MDDELDREPRDSLTPLQEGSPVRKKRPNKATVNRSFKKQVRYYSEKTLNRILGV